MGTVISNLKARFGVDTAEFKKGLKDGERAVEDFKGAADNSINELADIFGINMGAVNESVETARKSFNFLVSSFQAGAGGANKFAIAMKVLKTALISSGIGALVVALGSVAAYFTKSESGADKLAKKLSQIRSILDNLVERLVKFGGGLVDIFSGKFREGWEQMRTAFNGIGKEITNDWKEAGRLAEAEDALEDREIALINSLEERRAKVAELRLQAREELEDHEKKIKLLMDAEKLIKSVYGDEISLERERLQLMKDRIALKYKEPKEVLASLNREIEEQEAKINSLMRAQSEELKALLREKNSAINATKKELELKKEEYKLFQAMVKDAKIAGPSVDLSKLKGELAQVNMAVIETATSFQQSISDALNEAFAQMISNVAFVLGELAAGTSGIKNVSQVVLSTLADLGNTVGKLLIQAGLASLALFQALQFPNPATAAAAIAAGAALIAISGMIKGAMSRAAGGGSVATATAATGSYTFDTRNIAGMKQEMEITGKLTASGRDLVYVFNKEDQRIKSTIGGPRR